MSLRDRVAHRAFMAAAIVFGVGTLLTKAHYTADLFGAFLIAYAVSARVTGWWFSASSPDASRPGPRAVRATRRGMHDGA